MGRLVYDATKVASAIEELNNALTAINDMTIEMRSGIEMIKGARGIKYVDVNLEQLNKIEDLIEDTIEEDIKIIREKSEKIEEYNQLPGILKFFSTAGLTLAKFVEGASSGVESIIDGGASIVGFAVGWAAPQFQSSIAEFVKKDYVGDWYYQQYENGILEDINAYSYFSHTSTYANIWKGVGYAAPYIVLGSTGVGLATETAVSGIAGIGQGTQEGLQIGSTFNQAFAGGLWQGAKNAALTYTMGRLSRNAQNTAAGKGTLGTGNVDDYTKFLSGNTDDIAATAKNMFGCTDDLVATPITNPSGAVTGYKLTSRVTSQAVGDITIDGTNVIARSFGQSGAATTTRILKGTGDEILYNVVKDPTDYMRVSFDELASRTDLTASEKFFTKAGEFKNTAAGQALKSSDDAISSVGTRIAGSGPGRLLSRAGNAVTNSRIVRGVTNNGLVRGVVSAATSHPGTTYALTAGVYAADQVNNATQATQYKMMQAELASRPEAINIELPVGDIPPNYEQVDKNTSIEDTSPNYNYGNSGAGNISSGFGNGNGSNINNNINNNGTDTNTGNTSPETNLENNQTQVPNNNSNNIGNQTPGNNNNNNNNQGQSSVQIPQGGGEYNDKVDTEIETTPEEQPTEPPSDEYFEEENLAGSFADLITGDNEYVEIPTSSTPITTTTENSSKKSIIPVIAGLGAAAVAGIGTKAYLDKKEENENNKVDMETDEWESDGEQVDFDYNNENISVIEKDYLEPTDEYAYQEESIESYRAVNSSELDSMN